MHEPDMVIDGAKSICAERLPGICFEHLALHWRITALSRAIESEQAIIARQERLTINTLHMLLTLRLTDGPLRPSDLSHRLCLTNAAITGCLDRLEIDGLVSRDASDTDRRVRQVALTDAGKQTADRLFQRCASDIPAVRLFQTMPAEARAVLNDQLRWLLQQLEDTEPPRGSADISVLNC